MAKRVNLTKSYGNAVKQFRSMTGKGKEYDIGFIHHTSIRTMPRVPICMHPQRLDCLEMLAQVAQESYGLFKE